MMGEKERARARAREREREREKGVGVGGRVNGNYAIGTSWWKYNIVLWELGLRWEIECCTKIFCYALNRSL